MCSILGANIIAVPQYKLWGDVSPGRDLRLCLLTNSSTSVLYGCCETLVDSWTLSRLL